MAYIRENPPRRYQDETPKTAMKDRKMKYDWMNAK
jgi:hypothetical protein